MRGKLPIIVELHRWRLAFILTFLVIVCARWAGIEAWASDTPFADEWDAEGVFLYPKLADGTLSAADFFHPANEHHIIFTHLLNSLLLYINGQWDPIVQMMASSSIMAFVYAFLAYQISKRSPPILACGGTVVCILLGMPLASSANSLAGYQSQVAFCLFFSVLAMAGWTALPRPRWGRALLATTCAVFSMGPGLFTPLAALPIAAVMASKGNKIKPLLPYMVPSAIFLPVVAIITPKVATHANIGATSVAQFMEVCARGLAWPNTLTPILCIPANIPILILIYQHLRSREPLGHASTWAILLTSWGAAAAAAMALTRGNHFQLSPGAGVPSRYADFFALSTLGNGVALTILYIRAIKPTWVHRTALAAWSVLFLFGWFRLTASAYAALEWMNAEQFYIRTKAVHAVAYQGQSGHPRQPHPDADIIRQVVSDKRLEAILPPSIRRPIGINWPMQSTATPFLTKKAAECAPYGVYPVWSSFEAIGGPHRTGEAVSASFHTTKYAVELNLLVIPPFGEAAMSFLNEKSGIEYPLHIQEPMPQDWQTVWLRIPPGDYKLQVRNSNPKGFIGFTEPRELGPLSYWARRTLSLNQVFLPLIALTSTAIAIFIFTLMVKKRQNRSTPQAHE